ncbi:MULTISPECIES: hypothetical protein [Streptomyces]|uniref:Uncharacterized protein n=1 Tax=Streptomyces olivaceus TaxID=47716 RepID=A0ABS7W7A9_STROV|nr:MULTISPECIES: hypothetical protein [Streptomyces]MBZ6081499.1 hypothetical protein [Streptomyces olivaceus]MBZ6091113.1 hypothetical protein [Streptomyces olivaceus]MBZ6097644.1 hypothetical protein [Streptomyces olivaceus]MBZ6102108.1 hypothetical protein [Streptomyces olivaceus]MBZ6112120.1 hypothetical protein [Streptomyces olivaceus]
MNDASTTQPIQADGADVPETDTGHGKHRGPVSSQEGEATPQGRHRKPAGESEVAA